MKKLISAVLCIIALAAFAPVYADVIWEPDDSFYSRHADECEYVGRTYVAAGYDGSVALYDSPNGIGTKKYDNGTTLNVQFVWGGDAEWGYAYRFDGGEEVGGWIPMDDLSLMYDSRQFFADHESEITSSEPVEVNFSSAVMYSYPRGPKQEGMLTEDTQYMSFSELFTETYTDSEGLRWGYVGYYMGRHESWVCLDDPMNENLDTEAVEPSPSAAQLRGSPSAGTGYLLPVLSAVLVFAVVAVTALAIKRLYPKKNG